MALLMEDGGHGLNRMVDAYDFAREKFEPLHVQLYFSSGPVDFVTGDTPLVIGNADVTKLGTRDGVALGDAKKIYMPLGRTVGMALWGSQQPPDIDLTPSQVREVNMLVWRTAARFIVCHPSVSPSMLFDGVTLTNSSEAEAQAS
jgi:hypothetical protein